MAYRAYTECDTLLSLSLLCTLANNNSINKLNAIHSEADYMSIMYVPSAAFTGMSSRSKSSSSLKPSASYSVKVKVDNRIGTGP